MSVDDFDILACYRDLWKARPEKRNAIEQGIISSDSCTLNCIKLRINTGDKSAVVTQDKAIADAYRNKFINPLDFEMLDSSDPITKQDSEKDYAMNLRSMITTKLSIHQKPMPQIKLQTYP